MQTKKFQYFIGIGLPEKESEFFDYLKKQFHPNGNLSSPAHITIIPPFFHDNEIKLLKRLDLLSKKINIFKVLFEKVDCFRQSKYGTVYLAPDKDDGFQKIFNEIFVLFPHLPKKRGDNFIPHLTIANRTPLDELELTKNKLELMQIKLVLKVKSIILFRRISNSNWEKFKEIDFKKN